MSYRAVILGAGESGTGAALLAQKRGYAVFVSDNGPIKEDYKKTLTEAAIEFEEGRHSEAQILNADIIIKSPGIPEKAPVVQKLRAAGILVIDEIEFAWRHARNATVVGITGSNGKSTTTALTYHLLKNGGLNVAMGGNIGKSFARLVVDGDYEYYVLELSSFQLDGIKEFKPHISVLLNITPDHLDRYDYKLENYVNSKFRIAMNQDKDDYFIYCADDELTMKHFDEHDIKALKIPFSIKEKEGMAAYTEDDQLIINIKQNPLTMPFTDLTLKGQHNIYNTMAAGITARIFDLRKESIRESMTVFKSLEHRLEPVAKVRGVEFINDSKATNVNSAWYALEATQSPIIWIAGGVDKGNDYSVLVPLVKEKVKAIVCMGVDNIKIHQAFSKYVDIIVNTMSAEEAVKISYHLSDKGDTVLLSPACSSFDLFQNYEDRGRQFKMAVRAL